jgi:hypothetical protein
MSLADSQKFTEATGLYTVDCTGNACVGDEVFFLKGTFTGVYPKAKFNGYEPTEGKIVKDSYGKRKQQHTFTIELKDTDIKILVKGRNLYRNGTFRKLWADEKEREIVIQEKISRGDVARAARRERKERNFE